jgi:hypothetical protein
MPTESLVLSVLQILVDASQCTNEAQPTNFFSKAIAPNNNHVNNNSISIKARPTSGIREMSC